MVETLVALVSHLLPLLVAGGLGVFGGLLAWWAFMRFVTGAKQQGDPLWPRCARCEYLLRGLGKPVCPECGGDLSEPGSVRLLRRKQRYGLVGLVLGMTLPLAAIVWLYLAITVVPVPQVAWLNVYFDAPASGAYGRLQVDATLERGRMLEWTPARMSVPEEDISVYVDQRQEVLVITREPGRYGAPWGGLVWWELYHRDDLETWLRDEVNLSVRSAQMQQEIDVVDAALRAIMAGEDLSAVQEAEGFGDVHVRLTKTYPMLNREFDVRAHLLTLPTVLILLVLAWFGFYAAGMWQLVRHVSSEAPVDLERWCLQWTAKHQAVAASESRPVEDSEQP